MNIKLENAVFKYAASFLPKWKVDAVAQYADANNLYVMAYAPISDEWALSCGEVYTTKALMKLCPSTS